MQIVKLRLIWLSILFIALVAVTVRLYLIVSEGVIHEMGIDSFFYHNEANVLIKYHTFTWWLHPLSLWGLYPYSDAPASPTLVAQISLLTGISVEQSILLFDVLITIFAGLSLYLLSLTIKNNATFAFFTSLVFVLAPIVVVGTRWSLGEREFLVYMIPLLTLFLVYILKGKHRRTIFSLVILVTFVISTIHLISLFLYGLFLSLVFIQLAEPRKVFKKWQLLITNKPWLSLMVSLTILLLAMYSLFILDIFFNMPYSFSIKNYESTALFEGTGPLIILINIGVSLSGGVGILLPVFLPLGIIYTIIKKAHGKLESYLFWSLVFSFPILINRLYSRPVMVFLSSILIGYGVWWFLNRIDISKGFFIQLIKILIIIALLVSTASFTVWYDINRHDYRVYTNSSISYMPYASPDTYEIGVYQKYRLTAIWVTNDWLTGQRIQAYSSVPSQPGMVGSPSLQYNPVYFKLVSPSELGIHKSTEIEFKYTHKLYFSTYLAKENRDYWSLIKSYIKSNNAQTLIKEYNIYYAVEYRDAKGYATGFYSQSLVKSNFFQSVDSNTYIVFRNGDFSVYLL